MANDEHHAIRAALSKSQQRLQLHFERTPLAVIEWDLAFQVSEWNPAAQRIFGYTREEALGRHAAGLIVPASAREHVDRIWKGLCSQAGGLRSTNENNCKDGSIILCEWYNTPLVDEQGQVLGVASLVQDITEQRRAELALRASEENLRITLDSIGDAVISTDAHGRVLRINRVASHLTGWPAADAQGRTLDEVLRVEGERDDTHPDAILVARDGRRYEISRTSSPIRDDRGELVGMAVVFRDETERRALERQVRRVQHLNALGQLAGGVAHDFNNMLTGIRGYAQILSLELGDPSSRDNIEGLREFAVGIEHAAVTAAELTGKLLAFSRHGKSASTVLDVHQPIGDAIGLLRRSIDRQITLTTQLDAAQTTVLGDSAQLQNAILNLGINARDAMPSGGTLTISTRDVVLDAAWCGASPFELEPGPYVRVEVVDTGIGMRPEVMDRMFEPFFSTKEAKKGTGLGLAAVYGTISEHGGAISATSTEGVGSRFIVDLPVADRPPQEELDPVVEAQPPPSTGSVLIVDDEPIIRKVAQRMAQRLGYRVLLACDGREGLDTYLAHRSEIDVVVLDIVMPHMNGRECFRAIRAANPAAKVILCSGFARDTSISELFDEGLVDYITKPFAFERLKNALQAATTGPSQPRV